MVVVGDLGGQLKTSWVIIVHDLGGQLPAVLVVKCGYDVGSSCTLVGYLRCHCVFTI